MQAQLSRLADMGKYELHGRIANTSAEKISVFADRVDDISKNNTYVVLKPFEEF